MIFVTGGAGYIGTHTCVELLNAGHEVTVFDNGKGEAYEVEFLSLDGNTIGVSTVEAADLRQASGRAVLHERELLAA